MAWSPFDIWSRLEQPQKSDLVLQHYRVALHELGYSDDEIAEEVEAFYNDVFTQREVSG